jgi:DNA-binding transcriptional ArsR family regulator
LVPGLVSRPWIVISEWDSTKIFCYPGTPRVAAEAERERDMIRVYRALGDETRLRILREVAGGDRRIADLAHSLGLAKSTIHSHLAILRTAGLVRLSIGAEKRFELLKGRPDLNQMLDDYLGR